MSFNRINTKEQVFAKPAVQLRRCTAASDALSVWLNRCPNEVPSLLIES
jgi:hypothetical protein